MDPTGAYVYIAGYLSSVNFIYYDHVQIELKGKTDALIAKYNTATRNFVYLTRLGGTDIDTANGIAVDSVGNAYVVGTSKGATDFPTTFGAAATTTPSRAAAAPTISR